MQDNCTDIESRIERLKDASERLKKAKESLEIEGVCPESDSTHEEDPYNIGFIWASICNSLHCATDALNGLLEYIEPGGLKELLEDTEITTEPQTLDQTIQFKPEKLEDDGK